MRFRVDGVDGQSAVHFNVDKDVFKYSPAFLAIKLWPSSRDILAFHDAQTFFSSK